jgi:hypothetical protein
MLYKEIIAVCVILLVYILNSDTNSTTVDEATTSSNGDACVLCAIVLCGQIYCKVATAASSVLSHGSNLFIAS